VSVKSELVVGKLHFVVISAVPYDDFYTYFQKDEFLAHTSALKLSDIFTCIPSRLLKPEHFQGELLT